MQNTNIKVSAIANESALVLVLQPAAPLKGSTAMDKSVNGASTLRSGSIDSDRDASIGKGMDPDLEAKPEEMHFEEVYYDPVDAVTVEDCCPRRLYRYLPCLEGKAKDSQFWREWHYYRLKGARSAMLDDLRAAKGR